MKNNSFFIIILALMLSSGWVSGQVAIQDGGQQVTLSWNPVRPLDPAANDGMGMLSFSGSALRAGWGLLPVWIRTFAFDPALESVGNVALTETVFQPVPAGEATRIAGLDTLPADPPVFSEIAIARKIPSLRVSIIPLRRNPGTGAVEKLVSFVLSITRNNTPVTDASAASPVYAEHSVLATGSWYKFAVANNGICRLGYNDLKNAGFDVNGIDPRNIRIYGNGGAMLPEANAKYRTDDLKENAIFISGEEDGKFDAGDYILFYGQSPDNWVYTASDKLFHHRKNVYSDRSYYFLTADLGPGKRIGQETSTNKTATVTVTKFEDYAFYEKDEANLIKTGREWWDKQYFDATTTRDYSFSFPGIDETSPVTLKTDVASRSTSGSTTFITSAQGNILTSIPIPSITGNSFEVYARKSSATGTFLSGNPVINVTLTYNRSSVSAVGYLNYLEINAKRKLGMSGSQMNFRTAAGTSAGSVSEFILNGNGQNLQIWDVTDGGSTRKIVAATSGSNYIFRLETDTLREFVAFDGSSFETPAFVGQVANQDLHGAAVVDFIIVTHPDFLAQAEKLAEFHRTHDNMSVLITTPGVIYNEFSSGAQDITAIRDFVRMMYNRAEPGREPKYLLLFGDASYDYKDRVTNNTNFVPAFESIESLSPSDSFVSDDYFGMLNTDEGQSANGDLDIGVGRFPVDTPEEAEEEVNKVIMYCSQADTVKNDWRNVVTFVADDQNEGGNTFIDDSEDLAAGIEKNYKSYNVDKIYSDAYTMISTPGGGRYPEVNDAINKRVEKGTLIVNYVGHGGEVGWAHERILEVADIQGWRNLPNLPVFVTATCEFSRFDDPGRVSAGEWVFLNGKGGGIALFTTTRLTYAHPNKLLLDNLYESLFKKSGNDYLRLGDLLVAAKKDMGSAANIHAFVLLGDPAMRMAYPELKVVTTAINSREHTSQPDTLSALSVVTVSGEIRDAVGQLADNFSGTVYPTVYDKPSEIWTKANQQIEEPVQFFLRKNTVYKGKVNVVNGKFSYSFIVPKDIALNYGAGKISYYAKSPETDANGYDGQIVVGGYNNQAEADTTGPEVALFMNDRRFISGGLTNGNPVLLADVSDLSGVNTVGNGIGHDITAVLDNKSSDPMILNDYYVSDLNTFKSGTVAYPLSGLDDGQHQIRVKVWDVYNNSTNATIEFIVASSADLRFEHLMNYPNPMRDLTTFAWQTNQVDQPVRVEIRIFTIDGNLVKTIHQEITPTGFREASVKWDGTQDNGRKISPGMYIYKVRLTLSDGSDEWLTSKLVVIR